MHSNLLPPFWRRVYWQLASLIAKSPVTVGIYFSKRSVIYFFRGFSSVLTVLSGVRNRKARVDGIRRGLEYIGPSPKISRKFPLRISYSGYFKPCACCSIVFLVAPDKFQFKRIPLPPPPPNSPRKRKNMYSPKLVPSSPLVGPKGR